jgi:hypothetical protein
MTDWNMRDIFELCTGRCGHKWVTPSRYVDACAVCGDRGHRYAGHVVAREPIPVNIAYVWEKLARRRARAIREGRSGPRKTATVVSLRLVEADGQRPTP